VLRGELSLVGPRPHAVAHDKHYSVIVEQYASRSRIKPGITGLAQVRGFRSGTRDPEMMRQRVKHDIYYIDNWSPGLDIKILFRTIGVVLWDRQAY
jgi:lipopolysaccharide/colanic/teichoic acid biosynthesis glycosyltransferase